MLEDATGLKEVKGIEENKKNKNKKTKQKKKNRNKKRKRKKKISILELTQRASYEC